MSWLSGQFRSVEIRARDCSGGADGADALALDRCDSCRRSSFLFLLAIVVAKKFNCQYSMRADMLLTNRRGRRPDGQRHNPTHHGPGPGAMADSTVHRNRRCSFAPVRRCLWHFWSWERDLPVRGPRGGAGSSADMARTERAVDGVGSHWFRQGQASAANHGSDVVYWTRSSEHG